MRYSSENITNEDIYFSVIDAETEETIVNFSFTKYLATLKDIIYVQF